MNRRKAALLAVLLLLLPLLSACHGGMSRSSFVIPREFDETRPVSITFWAKNDTNQNQTAVYKQAIADFEALYPNVNVDIRLYTDYSRIYNDVITNISTNTTPNVCITYPDHIATYLTGSNVVVELDSLMSDPDYGLGGSKLKFDSPAREQVVPQFLGEGTIGGRQYALPFMRSTEALYINRNYVEALGYEVPEVATWDFIWEVSEAAMAKNEDGTFVLNGQKTMIPFIYKSTDNMMISMLRQRNAGYSTEAGEVLIFNEVTDGILKEIHAHAGSRAFSTFSISGYPANFLNAGQCVFAIDSTAGATWMGSDAPLLDIPEENLVPFETVVRPIPQYDPEHPQMISQGPSVCIFSREDQQEVLASWLFAQFLLTDKVQTGYAETEGYLPVTFKAQKSAAYQDYLSRRGEDSKEHYAIKIDASRLLMDHLEDTFITPVFNGSASLRQAAGDLIEETAKAARRKKEMNDAFLEKLHSDMISLYRLNQLSLGEESGEAGDQELPDFSKGLLWALAGIWVLIGLLELCRAIRKSQRQKTEKSNIEA